MGSFGSAFLGNIRTKERDLALKIGTVAVGTVVLFALSATLAQGKGDLVPATWRATVTGPGLPGSVDFQLRGGCEPQGNRCGSLGTGPGSSLDSLSFFENAGLAYPLWANQKPAMAGPPPSPDSLGERYSIVTRFTSQGRTFIVHQELYPYGSSPWLHTPAGQRLPYPAVRAGW